ncbi:MAG: hypothetical protein FWE16_06155 [Firmicutes bacterium]|nr:hypothetical protein [Bacillota bacterium]
MANIDRRTRIGLLGIGGCHAVVMILVNVFFVARIFVVTDESLVAVGLFSIVHMSSLFLFFAVSATVSKRTKAVYMTRLSVFLVFVLLVLLLVFDSKLSSLYILFGFLWGLAEGFYWGAHQYLKAKGVKREAAAGFVSASIVILMLVKLIFPVTLGLLIDRTTFMVAISITMFFGFLMIVFSFLVAVERENGSSTRLSIKKYLVAARERGAHRETMVIFLIAFLKSFIHASTLLLPVIIILALDTNFSLGILTTIFGVTSVLAILAYQKFGFKHFWMFGIIMFLGSVPLIFMLVFGRLRCSPDFKQFSVG